MTSPLDNSIMEMTGHTSDLLEALDQWKREREALAEFFELSERQDLQLATLRKQWAIIRKVLYGKEDIATQPPRIPTDKQMSILCATVQALDMWAQDVTETHQDYKKAEVDNWKQISLFSLLKK
jgi:hypothetical protein